MRYTIQNYKDEVIYISTIISMVFSMLVFTLNFVKDFIQSLADTENLIAFIAAVIGIINLFIITRTYRLDHSKEFKSVVSIKAIKKRIEDARPELANPLALQDDYYINSTSTSHIFYDKDDKYLFGAENGYSSTFHSTYDWYFEIQNLGNYPSKDIELKYVISIEKFKQTYSENELGELLFIEDPYVDIVIDMTEKVPYLAAGETKKIFVTNLNGEFPIASLKITSFKSENMTFVDTDTIIDSYTHAKIQNYVTFKEENIVELAGVSLEELPQKFGGLRFKEKRAWWQGEVKE